MSPDANDTTRHDLVEPSTILVVNSRVADGRAVVEIAGELDLSGTQTVSVAVRGLLEESPSVERIEIDATKVAFIDSTGLHLLLDLQANAADRNVAFEVAAASDAFRRVVEMAGVAGFLLPSR